MFCRPGEWDDRPGWTRSHQINGRAARRRARRADLDLDALDVVEEALRRYRRMLLVVTHDRFFADAVGFGRRWHVAGGAVIES